MARNPSEIAFDKLQKAVAKLEWRTEHTVFTPAQRPFCDEFERCMNAVADFMREMQYDLEAVDRTTQMMAEKYGRR